MEIAFFTNDIGYRYIEIFSVQQDPLTSTHIDVYVFIYMHTFYVYVHTTVELVSHAKTHDSTVQQTSSRIFASTSFTCHKTQPLCIIHVSQVCAHLLGVQCKQTNNGWIFIHIAFFNIDKSNCLQLNRVLYPESRKTKNGSPWSHLILQQYVSALLRTSNAYCVHWLGWYRKHRWESGITSLGGRALQVGGTTCHKWHGVCFALAMRV